MMIVNQNHTHVRTNPVRLGRIHLYRPHAFKGDENSRKMSTN